MTATPATIATDTAVSDGGPDIGAGRTVTFAVTFSDPITVTDGGNGDPSLGLTGGRTAHYLGTSGTTLSFGYTVQPGDNVGDLQAIAFNALPAGTTIKDASNVDADLGGFKVIDSGVVLDTTAPVVTGSVDTDVVKATSDAGAVATFRATSQDAVDGTTDPITFTEQLPGGGTQIVRSGDTFAVGEHTIVASATDAAANTGSSAPFTFVILPQGTGGAFGSGGGVAAPTPVPVDSDPSLCGALTHDVTSPGGEVYALYEAILGHAPDPLGFETNVAALNRGTSIETIARNLLVSGADVGAPVSNSAFVDQLYDAALHRAPTDSELAGWNAASAAGTSRAEIAAEIALSPESQHTLAATFEAGVFVGDVTDAKIARLYYGLFDRAPDANGLAGFEAYAHDGGSLKTIAKDMIASSEFVALHGAPSHAQFVDALFEGALGRSSASGGAAHWMHELDAGASPASVAIGIAESPQAAAHLAPQVEIGFHVA